MQQLPKTIIFLSIFLFGISFGQSNRYAMRTQGSPLSKISPLSEGSKISSMTAMKQVLTYNGHLTLKVNKKKNEIILNKIIEETTKIKGYVENQTLSSITIKIPSILFKQTLGHVKNLNISHGGSTNHESISVQNITQQYYDTKIRLENAQKLQQRLKKLLDRGKSVTEVVRVETELSRVTEKIERLKGSMRLYQNQIDYSTINIRLIDDIQPGPIGYLFYGIYVAIEWLFVWY